MGEYVSEYAYDKPTVLIPRKGSISNLFYLEKPFWNVDTIYYTEIDASQIVPRYLYYYLTTIDFESMAINPTRPSLTQAILDKIELPIPSLEIQKRIVQVLDNFDTVCNDLNIGLPKEIELRQKQYEYFRYKLLTFTAEGVYADSTVQYSNWVIALLQWVFGTIRVELGAVSIVQRGKRVVRKELSVGEGYPVYQNSLTVLGYYERFNTDAEKTFIVSAGAAGEIGYSYEPFWKADDVWTIETDIVTQRYLYHILLDKQSQIKSQVRKASVPRLSKMTIEHLYVVLPPLDIQVHIASILDTFDTLTTDLIQGLPKEIELRQKQYEYWRDRLLDF